MGRATRAKKQGESAPSKHDATPKRVSARDSRILSSKTPASQAALPGLEFRKQLSFGGSLLKLSHAKTARPLSSKQALHVVLRSDFAQGSRSLLRHERVIRNMLLKQGRRHGVKVYRVANAGNHLHLLVRFTKRRGLQNFLRGSTGLIARKVLGAERGKAKKWDTYLAPGKSLVGPASIGTRRGNGSGATSERLLETNARVRSRNPKDKPTIPQGQRFWSQRPFTRIVSWGKDFNSVLTYVKLNSLEALGFLSRKFTKALPSQAIRNRVLADMSTALGEMLGARGNLSRAPETG
jgi:hypothetical protein